MAIILKKKPIKPSGNSDNDSEPKKYIDLNEFNFGEEAGEYKTVRIAEIYKFEDIKPLEDIINNGDILMIDYTPIMDDELTMRRIISELKQLALDGDGDIVSIGKNYIVVTPTGIKISRKKLRVEKGEIQEA
ncbi:MAG: cell division protein SepF [Thermoplasmata archaeon]